jgi:hypothetical protein
LRCHLREPFDALRDGLNILNVIAEAKLPWLGDRSPGAAQPTLPVPSYRMLEEFEDVDVELRDSPQQLLGGVEPQNYLHALEYGPDLGTDFGKLLDLFFVGTDGLGFFFLIRTF